MLNNCDFVNNLINRYTTTEKINPVHGADDLGKSNELFCTFLLNNKKWGEESLLDFLIERLTRMNKDAALSAFHAGKLMSFEFLKEARKLGYGGGIKQSVFAAMGSSIEGEKIDPLKNPSDVIVKFGWGPSKGWLGMSNKITTRSKGDITFKNIGMNVLENVFGMTDATNIISEYRKIAMEKFGVSTLKEFKAIRNRFDVKKLSTECQIELRNSLLNALQNLSKNESEFQKIVSEYLLNTQTDLFPPYLKVTGRILRNNRYKAEAINPITSPKYIALLNGNYEIKVPGKYTNAVGIYANQEPICQIRFKWSSEQFGSNMKTSVEPCKG